MPGRLTPGKAGFLINMNTKQTTTAIPVDVLENPSKPDHVNGVRRHRGDIMTPEKRSALMSRIRGRDTKPERTVAMMLARGGFFHETQARDLPGRPDFVMRDVRLVVMVDGDFWHGWRFASWRNKLSPDWEKKISANRARDARNLRSLRGQGWKVIKIWEHQVENDPDGCEIRIKRIWFVQAIKLKILDLVD